MPDEEKRPAGRKWRPAPAALVQTFEQALLSLPGAEPRRMFGYPCAFANGQMFAGVHQESLMIRLSEAERRELLGHAGAHLFEPKEGRPMREYVVVPPDIMASEDELHGWLERALRYASSLPPKPGPARSRRRKG